MVAWSVPAATHGHRGTEENNEVRWQFGAALLGLVAVLGVGCSSSPVATPPDRERPARSIEPEFGGKPALPAPNLANDGPGSLIESRPLDSYFLDTVDALSVRIGYRSTTADGSPSNVTGVVVLPPGTPPKGGWPVVSYNHDVTGVDNRCAPSLGQELGGYTRALTLFVQRGYAVVMPDYEGLGMAGGVHSILAGDAFGRNVIDAVRAAHRVTPALSNHWAAFGTGQGGLASWAAAELAGSYGQGLDFVGSVALSPYADLSGLVDAATSGNLSDDQVKLLSQVLQSVANMQSGFDIDSFRSVKARDQWQTLTDCAPIDPNTYTKVMGDFHADDLRPADGAPVDALRRALVEAALPLPAASPPAGPILVVYGTEDDKVRPKWIEDAVRRACDRGDQIEYMRRIGDPDGGNFLAVQIAMGWLKARFDGQKLDPGCIGGG